ncbi:hypothetical protein E4T47_07389 [Aureobasidium subglaciale]|nr:hypothetical protein E4T47_07389 [Aureobasidium subglaciale]
MAPKNVAGLDQNKSEAEVVWVQLLNCCPCKLQERTTPQSSLLPNDSPNLQLRLLTIKEPSRVSIPQLPTLCRYTRREIHVFSAH